MGGIMLLVNEHAHAPYL